MNEVRREMLAGIPFASSTVQAGLNAADALVEIEAVAAVPLDAARSASAGEVNCHFIEPKGDQFE